ncbi:hypothetical protein FMN50_11575 [Rhodobacterales bacterium]|nr:hypothetical protein FMN50_11575 [Rhodobacterales bacterium]
MIRDLCVRDATFIAANMRPADLGEIGCLWKELDTRVLGTCAVKTSVPGMAWSVWYEGEPAAAYGFSQAAAFDPDHWQAWAFGTERFRRCVPLITRHFKRIRPLVEQECRRLQVVTHAQHDISHGWIEALGGRREGVLRSYGRGGEDFYLYAWVREDRSEGVACSKEALPALNCMR